MHPLEKFIEDYMKEHPCFAQELEATINKNMNIPRKELLPIIESTARRFR